MIILPEKLFHSDFYLTHNAKRLEHLESLNLPLDNLSVLEVGAGIGDHTDFFIKRNCSILTTEVRNENLEILKKLPVRVMKLNLENIPKTFDEKFDVVYAYGILYHLNNPQEVLSFFSSVCLKFLLLETCVSFGNELSINLCSEPSECPTQ